MGQYLRGTRQHTGQNHMVLESSQVRLKTAFHVDPRQQHGQMLPTDARLAWEQNTALGSSKLTVPVTNRVKSCALSPLMPCQEESRG